MRGSKKANIVAMFRNGAVSVELAMPEAKNSYNKRDISGNRIA